MTISTLLRYCISPLPSRTGLSFSLLFRCWQCDAPHRGCPVNFEIDLVDTFSYPPPSVVLTPFSFRFWMETGVFFDGIPSSRAEESGLSPFPASGYFCFQTCRSALSHFCSVCPLPLKAVFTQEFFSFPALEPHIRRHRAVAPPFQRSRALAFLSISRVLKLFFEIPAPPLLIPSGI